MNNTKWLIAVALASVVVAGASLFLLTIRSNIPKAGPENASAVESTVEGGSFELLSNKAAVAARVASSVQSSSSLNVTTSDAEKLADKVTEYIDAWNQDSPETYVALLRSQGLQPAVDYSIPRGRTTWSLNTKCMRGAKVDASHIKVNLVPYEDAPTIRKQFGTPDVGYSYKSSFPDEPRGKNDPAFAKGGVMAEVVMPGVFPTIDDTTGNGEFVYFFVRASIKSDWTLVGSGSRGKMKNWISPPPAK